MAEIKVRTKEELLLTDYNYYVFFKIEPNEKDVAKIEKTINLERNKWTQGQPIQRRYKELYDDVVSVMIKDVGFNPSTGSYSVTGARAKELENAKKLKLGEALKLVTSLANNKGRIYKSELLQIVSAEKIKWFAVEDLEAEVNLLVKQGVKYIDDTQTVVDFRKYKEIEKFIPTAQVSSLYELVELEPTAPISAFAPAVKAANTKNAPQATTPKGTARGKMLGIADSIFKTEESKKKYDDYLKVKESVWDELELRQSHGIKEITLDEFLNYADIMKTALNAPIDQVELLLAAGLKEFKLIVQGDGAKDEQGNEINLENCPYAECGKAYRVPKNGTIKSCPHCGKALEIICWNCGGDMPFTTKSKTCPKCGGTFQSKALFEARLNDIEKIVRVPGCNINDLRSALSNLMNVVPNYKAIPSSFTSKKISEFEAVIAKRIKEEETTGASYKKDVEAIQEQIVLKKYQQANNMALNLRRNYPTYNVPNTTGLINDIAKFVTQAQAQVQQAKAYMAQKNEVQAITYAAKALEICVDCMEARQILNMFPPSAPTNVRASVVGGNSVRVEWDRVGNQSMTTYTVIKKVGSVPTSTKDGTVIESNLTINFYEDTNIVSATPYYYAVFADRCETPSALVASRTPVQVFLDVTGVTQEVLPDVISARWDVPHNVKAVEVWKKSGPVAPLQPGDGEKVSVKDNSGFVDSDCDGECSYLIICQYELNGTKKYSQGIRRVFKKYEELKPLKDVSIVQQPSGEFVLKCIAPEKAKLSVVYSVERLACKSDTVLQMMDFNKLCKNGTTVNVAYDGENTVFSIPANQVVWAYPMISNEQLFCLSAPVLVNTIAGIRGVSFTESNGTVTVTGTIDPRIKKVIAKISTTKFPLEMTDEGDKIEITKAQFENDGGAVIKLKADTLSYISLFTELEQNGKTTYTRAVPVGDEPIGNLKKKVVQYSIEYEAKPNKSFPIVLKFAADEEVELPRLCIMKGTPPPMDKRSGELVEKVEPIKLKKGFFSKRYTAKVSVTVPPDSPRMRFKLFIDDDSKKHVQLKEVRTI